MQNWLLRRGALAVPAVHPDAPGARGLDRGVRRAVLRRPAAGAGARRAGLAVAHRGRQPAPAGGHRAAVGATLPETLPARGAPGDGDVAGPLPALPRREGGQAGGAEGAAAGVCGGVFYA